MSTALYIISTIVQSEKNEYKLGKHTGSKKKLLSRYTTSLINPILYYFRYSKNSGKIELILKQHFEKERIINNNGNKTEWINIKLNILIDKIDKIFLKYEKNNFDENNFNKDSFNKDTQQFNNEITRKIYKCNNCSYETDRKYDFNNHINRKIPCYLSKSKKHGNANKNINTPYCEICKKEFSREDSLSRHNKTFHV